MRLHASALLCTLLAHLAVAPFDAAAADFLINELMPRNDSFEDAAFLDEDGSKQGWIEIKNTTASTASLLGWSLSTDASGIEPWSFPDVSVASGASVVVWLSGKNRTQSGAPLHTDFTLMRGEDCYLFDAQGALTDAIEDTSIPVDHSFGRCHDTDTPGYYYNEPSPGAENDEGGHAPFVILEEHVSLEVGVPHALRVWPDVEVTWQSDNPNVSVSASGVISASQDALAPDGRATIMAQLVGTTFTDATEVTIVDWTANASTLEIAAVPKLDAVLGQDETGIYFSVGTDIYQSADGLVTQELVGTLPMALTSSARMLVTPFGYLIRANQTIYHSTDLSSWALVFETQHSGLHHSFAAHYDEGTQTGYVYAGEYSSQTPESNHRVYRGTFPVTGGSTWQTLLDFAPLEDWQEDPSVTSAVRHVHVVTVDPHTGDVYVATGDANEHCRIYSSRDNGDSFQLLGMGDQSVRTLAIWFTADYVYWNMDTTAPQSIWRIPRSEYLPGAGWPSLTPELTAGTTTPGIKYYVTRNDAPGRFPVGEGEIFRAAGQSVIDSTNTVRPVNDPFYDYREQVAPLTNGSQWYQAFALSDAGDGIALMGAAAEGALRDRRGRLFGVKEGPGGAPIVQELHSLRGDGNWLQWSYRQLTPLAQDPAGFIFLRGRSTPHEFYQARLAWYDDASSVPSDGLWPPEAPEVCVTPLPEPGLLMSLATLIPVLALLQRRRERSARRRHAQSS